MHEIDNITLFEALMRDPNGASNPLPGAFRHLDPAPMFVFLEERGVFLG